MHTYMCVCLHIFFKNSPAFHRTRLDLTSKVNGTGIVKLFLSVKKKIFLVYF